MKYQKYDYKYALVPLAEAREKLNLGWRKVDPNGNALINSSEVKCLPGETFEGKVEAAGGRIMTPDEARYYRKTTIFTMIKKQEVKEPIVEPEEEYFPEVIEPVEPIEPTEEFEEITDDNNLPIESDIINDEIEEETINNENITDNE